MKRPVYSRMLSLFLAFVMVLSMVQLPARADTEETETEISDEITAPAEEAEETEEETEPEETPTPAEADEPAQSEEPEEAVVQGDNPCVMIIGNSPMYAGDSRQLEVLVPDGSAVEVVWSLREGDEAFASIDPTSGVLTAAADLASRVQVLVTATPVDPGYTPGSAVVSLFPSSERMILMREETNVTGLTLDWAGDAVLTLWAGYADYSSVTEDIRWDLVYGGDVECEYESSGEHNENLVVSKINVTSTSSGVLHYVNITATVGDSGPSVSMQLKLAGEQLLTEITFDIPQRRFYPGESIEMKAHSEDPNETFRFELMADSEPYASFDPETSIMTVKSDIQETVYITFRVTSSLSQRAPFFFGIAVDPLANGLNLYTFTIDGEYVQQPVDSDVLEMELDRSFLYFGVEVLPSYRAVIWSVETSGGTCELNQQGLEVEVYNFRFDEGCGTMEVCLTATAQDPGEFSKTLTLKLTKPEEPDEPIYDYGNLTIEAPKDRLSAGQSMTLTARKNGEKVKVQWFLGEDDLPFASIDKATGKLTARKTIKEHVQIAVHARTDGEDWGVLPVDIYPLATGVQIMRWESDWTGKTVTVPWFVGGEAVGFDLMANVEPSGAPQDVIWKVTGPTGSFETEISGNFILLKNMVVPKGKTSAAVVITATANDGSGKKAAATIKLVAAAEEFHILGVPEYLEAGKSVTLKTDLASRKDIADKKVTWSFANPEDYAYASINPSTGKITANAVVYGHTLTVAASTEAGIRQEAYVQLVPVPVSVSISTSLDPDGTPYCIPLERNADGSQPALQLFAQAAPLGCPQKGTWKSSNTKVAVIDAEGNVTFMKDGEATFTYTVGKVSDFVKVALGVYVDEVQLTVPETLESGKKARATVVLNPNGPAPTNKTIGWYWEPYDAVSISAAGIITAKTVYEPTAVKIWASGAYPNDAAASAEMLVLPKANVLAIYQEMDAGEPYAWLKLLNNTTVSADLRKGSIEFTTAGNACSWTSSNKKVAEYDEATGSFLLKKTGMVTITAKSLANPKLTGKFTLNVIIPVDQGAITVVNKGTSVLTSGVGSTQLAVEIKNPDGTVPTNQKIRWQPMDNDIITVSAKGKVTVKAGVRQSKNCWIYVHAEDGFGAMGWIQLRIVPKATGIIIRHGDRVLNEQTRSIGLAMGKVQLTAEVQPMNEYAQANQSVTWKSSNPKIASVDPATGEVTLLKPGTVTITAAAADGSKVSAKFTMNVQ